MRTRLLSKCAAALLLFMFTPGATFCAQLNFTPGLILSEEYTDNLFLSSENEEDDYITSVGVSLNGEVLWRRAGISLTYAPTRLFHAVHSDQDNWRHAADLVTWADLTRHTRIDLTNSYLRTIIPNDQSANPQIEENPLARPLIEGDANRRGLREYYSNASNLRLTHDFGASDTVYAGARYSIFREVDDPPPGTPSSDNEIFEPSAGVTYWFNPRWGFQLDLLYSDRNYDERNDRNQYDGRVRFSRRFSRTLDGFVAYRHTYLDYEDDTLDSDATVYQPTIGFTYQLEQNATITFAAGYYFQEFEDAAREDDEGPIVDAEIFKRFSYRRARIDLIGRSGYTIDDRGVDDLGLNIYYEAQINTSYAFTQRLSGILSGSYRYDEYPDLVQERTDNSLRASAGLNYQALAWMALSLTYNYTDLSSDDPRREYVENNVMFTITLAPSNPIRLN